MKEQFIEKAAKKFGELIANELPRIEKMKQSEKATDFSTKETIVVGILPGDGVGPILMKQAIRVLKELVGPEIASGKINLMKLKE